MSALEFINIASLAVFLTAVFWLLVFVASAIQDWVRALLEEDWDE